MEKIIIFILAFVFIALVFAGSTALGIAILVKGYGLTVASWGWVVGGAIGQLMLIGIIQAIGGFAKALTD